MKESEIEGYNECIKILLANEIIDNKDLVEIWKCSVSQQKWDEYFGRE